MNSLKAWPVEKRGKNEQFNVARRKLKVEQSQTQCSEIHREIVPGIRLKLL